MKDPLGFIPPHGNYSQLQSYRKAEVVYDLTYRFCHRFLSQKDRTIEYFGARLPFVALYHYAVQTFGSKQEHTDEIFNED